MRMWAQIELISLLFFLSRAAIKTEIMPKAIVTVTSRPAMNSALSRQSSHHLQPSEGDNQASSPARCRAPQVLPPPYIYEGSGHNQNAIFASHPSSPPPKKGASETNVHKLEVCTLLSQAATPQDHRDPSPAENLVLWLNGEAHWFLSL